MLTFFQSFKGYDRRILYSFFSTSNLSAQHLLKKPDLLLEAEQRTQANLSVDSS